MAEPTPNERALAAVSSLLHDLGETAMVTNFVLIIEASDVDDRWLWSYTAPGQKRWESMGLLEHALSFERNFTANYVDPGDDDE